MQYWLPPFIWMAAIFFFSSQERVEVSDIFAVQFLVFKTLHIIEYGILYVLLYRAFRATSGRPEWQLRIDALLIAIFYGISDEIHQVMVPTREGRPRDVVIDSFGVTLTYLYIWKYLPRAPKRLKSWAQKLQLL